jgi:hypothetical protein
MRVLQRLLGRIEWTRGNARRFQFLQGLGGGALGRPLRHPLGGALPGCPASHGCVRLPFDFAARLFDATAMGMQVIVAPTDAERFNACVASTG